jgi:hypothetical protein
MDDLSNSGLADGASDGDDSEVHQSTKSGGEVAEGFYGIGHLQQAIARGINIPADDGANGSFCEGVINVIVAVEIIAGESKEAIASLDSSRVGAYTYEGTVTDGPHNAA